jgi:hypothetical protein
MTKARRRRSEPSPETIAYLDPMILRFEAEAECLGFEDREYLVGLLLDRIAKCEGPWDYRKAAR